MNSSERSRALKALDDAKAFIQGAEMEIGGDARMLVDQLRGEAVRIQQANASLVLALLKDQYCPASLFRPWASVRRIRDWRDAGHFKAPLIHGKISVKPSDFFKHWLTLKQ